MLNRQVSGIAKIKRPEFVRTPNGAYINRNGIPNDDPFFTIMEQIEEERHRTGPRDLPDLD